MKTFPDASIDAVVSDPPYGLSKHSLQDIETCLLNWLSGKTFSNDKKGYMNQKWDGWVPGPEIWKEVFRVLKPGGHMLVFAGTRSMDITSIAIRLAGFELRDAIGFSYDSAPLLSWIFGTGAPKSLDVSKAIDKMKGAEREVVGEYRLPNKSTWNLKQANGSEEKHVGGAFTSSGTRTLSITAPATKEAKQWDGWKTSLKPAFEPIILARKPIECSSVAENVLKHGCGALNIDACRVELGEETSPSSKGRSSGFKRNNEKAYESERRGVRKDRTDPEKKAMIRPSENSGRYPANFIHDGSRSVLSTFPENTNSDKSASRFFNSFRDDVQNDSRIMYCPKASRKERAEGCEENRHPTVKPVQLCRWLCRLITPPDGTVLDPFAGSGSTGIAALLEGFHFIGIEMEKEFCSVAQSRLEHTVSKINNGKHRGGIKK